MFTAPASAVAKSVDQVCGQSEPAPWSRALVQHITRFTVPATRQQASNKLFYTALVRFDVAGNWRLQAIIRCGGESAKMDCNIPIGPPSRKLLSLLPYLLLPPLLVVLFAINQGLRRQRIDVGIHQIPRKPSNYRSSRRMKPPRAGILCRQEEESFT
jgi:hypothetical protein